MKCGKLREGKSGIMVAPFAGAWVEIGSSKKAPHSNQVAPFAGAWVEMLMNMVTATDKLGRSLRGSVG